MTKKNELKLIKKIMRPYPGADVEDCIDEAIIESVLNKCDIEYDFNSKTFCVSYKAMRDLIHIYNQKECQK